MNASKLRVLYITNLPAPYKVEFLDLLGSYVDLTVIFERAKASDRNLKWVAEQKIRSYKVVELPSMAIGSASSLSMQIVKYLREHDFDTVLVNGYSTPTEMLAIWYLHRSGIPFGLMCDGMLSKEDKGLKHAAKTKLVSAASFWLSSGSMCDEALLANGANEECIYRYPFTSVRDDDVVGQQFQRSAYKSAIDCKSAYMVLYVGKAIPRKGIDVLIDAFKGVGLDCTLYLVGVGESDSTDLIDCQGLSNIVQVGFLQPDQLVNYYRAADLAVLPSREDIWGLVINEALANGTPVIATDRCGAAPELVCNGQNGWIVPSEDAQTLKCAIVDLLTNEDPIGLMNNSIKVAKDYTCEAMAARVWEVLQTCSAA